MDSREVIAILGFGVWCLTNAVAHLLKGNRNEAFFWINSWNKKNGAPLEKDPHETRRGLDGDGI